MQLFWDDDKGYGYFPVDPEDWPYDASYFAKYVGYGQSALGKEITQIRKRIVEQHIPNGETILDFGIGSGDFVKALREEGRNVYGYDVNGTAIEWLMKQGLYKRPVSQVYAMTFWDSFEHIPRPDKIMFNIQRYVFMSIPIFKDRNDALKSKHFRRDEHYWYFTHEGLVEFMRMHGFKLEWHGEPESAVGRECIRSYTFTRTPFAA